MEELGVKNTGLANRERQEILGSVVSEIKCVLEHSRSKVVVQVNQELLATYWKIDMVALL